MKFKFGPKTLPAYIKYVEEHYNDSVDHHGKDTK